MAYCLILVICFLAVQPNPLLKSTALVSESNVMFKKKKGTFEIQRRPRGILSSKNLVNIFLN